MSNQSLTALEIINQAFPEPSPITSREQVGEINRNIVYEIRKEKDNPEVQHLLVVEYKPKTNETIHLSGHGLSGAAIEEIESRIKDLKEVYEHVAYEAGDVVKIVRGGYQGITGEIVDVISSYMELDQDGYHFAEGGLLTIEDTIPLIALKYYFDGYTLKVDYPEADYGSMIMKAYTQVSTFYGYHYTVRVATKDLPFELSGDSLLVSISHGGIVKLKE